MTCGHALPSTMILRRITGRNIIVENYLEKIPLTTEFSQQNQSLLRQRRKEANNEANTDKKEVVSTFNKEKETF